jgi:UDP-N-acetylmuramoyl-tripeptide--D-alanyl-D-alanine ligase
MRPISLSEFADALGGELQNASGDEYITGFATDSRQVREGDAFLAIRGERVDGHDFVTQALKQGARVAVTEKRVAGPHVKVPNLVKGLSKFASKFRDMFSGPVIGITGSAGKTTTKEFVAAALSPLGPVLRTEGNRNTEYTAPLLWPDVREDPAAVVVEMGMRGFGQIAHLSSFSRPTIGLITNIGFAHLAQVGSREGIAQAKGELLESLPEDGTAVLWQGDLYMPMLRKKVKSGIVKTFGYTPEADCQITHYEPVTWSQCRIRGRIGETEWTATVPVAGRHLALNAASAILVASLCGIEPQAAADQIAHAMVPPMRMEVIAYNGATIVLDAYNASPPAVISAIETLTELAPRGKRKAVIGEMKELGDDTEELHRMVGRALATHGVDEVLFFGEGINPAWDECIQAGMPATQFSLAHELAEVTAFLKGLTPGDVVLVKGSRALELEKALVPLGISGI